MSLFFLLNPKVFFDAGSIQLGGFYETLKKKKKHEKVEEKTLKGIEVEEKTEEEVEYQPKPNPYTEEFNKNLLKYLDTLQAIENLQEKLKLLELENEIRKALEDQQREYLEKRRVLAKLILEMQEEEEMLFMLLISDS